jgi:hypothetical protein
MMGQPLDALPIWANYLLTVLVLLAAMEVGYRLTKARQRSQSDKSDAGVGPLVGATLALLAFLLAFVVGFAANISSQRRELVLQEANAIGTTYLRAGYLDEPYRTESKELLREYVDLRLAAVDSEQGVAVVTRSEEIHNELWASAEQVAIESPLPTISLYINSLAVFLLTSDAVRDKVADALKGEQFELIASNLTKEQEEELMSAFSAE